MDYFHYKCLTKGEGMKIIFKHPHLSFKRYFVLYYRKSSLFRKHSDLYSKFEFTRHYVKKFHSCCLLSNR